MRQPGRSAQLFKLGVPGDHGIHALMQVPSHAHTYDAAGSDPPILKVHFVSSFHFGFPFRGEVRKASDEPSDNTPGNASHTATCRDGTAPSSC